MIRNDGSYYKRKTEKERKVICKKQIKQGMVNASTNTDTYRCFNSSSISDKEQFVAISTSTAVNSEPWISTSSPRRIDEDIVVDEGAVNNSTLPDPNICVM